MKKYQLLFKFSDVIRTIEANSKEKAEELAQEILGDEPVGHDSFCYDVEVEEHE